MCAVCQALCDSVGNPQQGPNCCQFVPGWGTSPRAGSSAVEGSTLPREAEAVLGHYSREPSRVPGVGGHA